MRLAFTDAGNDPPSLTTRQAYDLLAQGFGPGFNGPLVVAVAMPGPTAVATVDHLRAAIAGTPGVAYVVPPQFNERKTGAVLVAYPTTVAAGGRDATAGADPACRRDPAGGRPDRGRRTGGG